MKNRVVVGKKPLLSAVFCIIAASAFAQVGADGTKSAAGEASPAMAALQTAYSLARYGYANESASALIEAAEILAQTIWKNEKTGRFFVYLTDLASLR